MIREPSVRYSSGEKNNVLFNETLSVVSAVSRKVALSCCLPLLGFRGRLSDGMRIAVTQKADAGDGPAYPIESVSNALRILLMLEDNEELRVTDCAAQLGVARSTAHRLLSQLAYHGFLRRNPVRRTYLAGDVLVTLGLAVIRNLDIRTRARPFMEALSKEVSETINLILLEGDEVRFVDAVETNRALRVGGMIGLRRPAHCTSVGKAILAALSEDDLRMLYPDEELRVMTDESLSTRTQLTEALAEVRDQGYAVAFTESDTEIVGIGVRIAQRPGQVPAGIAISAPASRISAEDLKRFGEEAMKTARDIADAMEQ